MESHGRGSFTSSEGPSSSKKRKIINDPESELDLMKRERENDKKLMEKQKNRIYEQTMEIGELKEKLEETVNHLHVDDEVEEKETELRAEINELQKRIEDEKADHEKSVAEMKLNLTNQISILENQIIEKDSKVKDLEKQLSSIIQIKSDPDDPKKLLQDKIDEFQLSNNGLKTQLRKSECERKELQVQFNKFQSFNDKSAKKIKELEAELQAKANPESSDQTKLPEVEEEHHHKKQQHKLSFVKLEKKVADENKIIKELKEKISMLEKNHKNVLQKNMLEKKNQIQKMAAKHEQEMIASKLKFGNETRKFKSQMDKLQSNVENLNKKISMLEQRESKYKADIVKQDTRILCMKCELTSIKVVSNDIQSNLKKTYEFKINQLESTVNDLTEKNIALNQSVQDERKKYKSKINGIKSEFEEEDTVMNENLIAVKESKVRRRTKSKKYQS